jgi:hypothetical protein
MWRQAILDCSKHIHMYDAYKTLLTQVQPNFSRFAHKKWPQYITDGKRRIFCQGKKLANNWSRMIFSTQSKQIGTINLTNSSWKSKRTFAANILLSDYIGGLKKIGTRLTIREPAEIIRNVKFRFNKPCCWFGKILLPHQYIIYHIEKRGNLDWFLSLDSAWM